MVSKSTHTVSANARITISNNPTKQPKPLLPAIKFSRCFTNSQSRLLNATTAPTIAPKIAPANTILGEFWISRIVDIKQKIAESEDTIVQ